MANWLELQGLGLTEGDVRIVDAISLKVSHGSTPSNNAEALARIVSLRLSVRLR